MVDRPGLSQTWSDGGPRTSLPRSPLFSWKGLLGLLLAAAGLCAALEGWWLVAAAPGVQLGARVVVIPPRLGLAAVAQRLEDAGVIRSRYGFIAMAAALGSARSLKAGEYEIARGANALAIVRQLGSGKVVQHPVVLREGSTLVDLARAVDAEQIASSEELLRTGQDPAFLRELSIPGDSVEGYLFPDTYQLVRGMTPEDILSRMVTRMREQVSAETLERARALDLSVHQLLTLASIIEREAVDRREMPVISAVFWNRLKRDIPLQADPTVQYAVGKQGQALTRADLQVDSPFNTYRHLGLPPGPIASPSRAAIDAAVRPAPVDYLYFVAMNERQHHFSTSLTEHNAAVSQYRQNRSR